MSDETKIVGNTRQQQDTSSQMREESKLSWARNFLNGAAVIILLLVGITLTNMELGLFWMLIVAVVLWTASNQLKGKGGKSGDSTIHPLVMSWWPPGLKVAASIVAAVAVLGSGIGDWTASVINKIDTTASCAASPEQPECVARDIAKQEKEAAERQRRYNTIQAPQVITQPKQYPLLGDCAHSRFVNQESCVKVVLNNNAAYQRTAPSGKCLVYSPKDLIHQEDLGSHTYRFTAKRGGEVTFYFYDLPIGKSYDGFTCGG